MQPSTVFTVLATVAVTMAAPNYWKTTSTSTATPTPTPSAAPVNQCQAGTQESCCNGSLLGVDCNLIIAGAVCDGTVACCDTTQNGLINLDLSCLALTL